MKTFLIQIGLIIAGFGLGIYTTGAILFGSASPFDVMKKENNVKLPTIKSLFWLCVVIVAVLFAGASFLK